MEYLGLINCKIQASSANKANWIIAEGVSGRPFADNPTICTC